MLIRVYLKDTSDFGFSLEGEGTMTLTASPNQTLTAYVDSDWDNDPDDFILVTGFLIDFGPSLILWTAKKQKLLTLMSTEAKFISLCDISREILWL